MINQETEQVIAEIFGKSSGWSEGAQTSLKMCPGFDDIKALASLFTSEPSEEDLQLFLEERPQFLLGLFGFGDDSDVAFMTKPPISSLFKADFAVLNVGQGGCCIRLIEIERSQGPLFTKSGEPSKMLRSAMKQVTDWSQWISANQRTFVRDTLDAAKKLPLFPQRSKNNSFKLRESEDIEQGWTHFGGFTHPRIKYAIVAGRWSNLNESERGRLTFVNSTNAHPWDTYTYDQVARRAYNRPVLQSWD